MPIYEYRRPDGSTFEIQQSFSDDPLAVDPDTGVPVERVLHPPAVHFKGSGFYNTDYGTRKRQRETAAAAASSSEGEKGSKEKPTAEKSSVEGSTAKAADTKSENGAASAKKSSEPKPVPAKS